MAQKNKNYHVSVMEGYKTIFYKSTNLSGSTNALNVFLNNNTVPNQGEIYIYWDSGSYYSVPLGTSPTSIS